MGKLLISSFGGLVAVSLGLGWALAAERGRQAPLNIVVSSFRVVPGGFYPAPNQAQPKSLFEGAKAQPQPGERYLVTEAKWTFYHTNGQSSMELAAPECIYDNKEQSASSAGPLKVQTADGHFALMGEGFRWCPVRDAEAVSNQAKTTNSVLFISNRVHTIVDASLLQSSSNQSSAVSGGPLQPVDIYADRFRYETSTGLGVYEGKVRAVGTNLSLTSEQFTIRLPIQERRLHNVLAEQDVVVDYAQVHATGQRADYSVDADLLQVTGQPTWRAEFGEGRADALTFERTNQLLRATGHTWLKIPSQGLGQSNLLSSLGPQTTSNSPPATTTNQWVEARSDRYEHRPGSTVFTGGVNVAEHVGEQVRGTLECEKLNLAFTGTNELQQLVAEEAVTIRQGDRGFKSGRAVFTPTNGLELTVNPSWRDGLREGKGDLIHLEKGQMLVRGNASIRLPANELAASGFLGQSPATNSDKPSATGTNQWLVAESEQYLLTPQVARFKGGVVVTHPRMKWKCDSVAVDFAPQGNRAERLVAEPAVEFDLTSDDGQTMRGTGEKAVYTYEATPAKTNEIVRLTGKPAELSMTNIFKFQNESTTNSFTCRNDLIVLDLSTFSLQTAGPYDFNGRVSARDTNKIQLPAAKWPK